MATSEAQARLDDLPPGSSPTRATAPPPRPVHNVVAVESPSLSGDFEVVAGQRRTLISGYERRCAVTATAVQNGPVPQRPYQRLNTRQINGAFLAEVAV